MMFDLVIRPEWPAFRCLHSEDEIHHMERLGATAYCIDCFKHFDAFDFLQMKVSAAYVELQRQAVALDGPRESYGVEP